MLLFLVFVLSAYVKIVTVLGILRVGLGTDSIPSMLVTSGLAFVLSLFVMYPTLAAWGGAAAQQRGGAGYYRTGLDEWRQFLSAHAHSEEKTRFANLAARLDGAAPPSAASAGESWRVLAPAFLSSELKEAFATGLSLFMPFLVIDLLIATVLAGVGLERLNPVAVAFPFKLLLFVMVDGWSLITINLASTYAAGG